MPIAYPSILELKEENQNIRWSDRDVLLYALSIGMGSGPTAAQELPFVYEMALRVVPTFVSIAAFGKRPLRRSGINYLRMVHAGQKLICHGPMPIDGDVIVDSFIASAFDKGVEQGAIVTTATQVRDRTSGRAIATLHNTIAARGDGGFGGPREGAPEPHPVPQRPPDQSITFTTYPNQALLHRLCGDRNPMHADPEVAAKAGFPRPLLHGLCTYGMACRAVLACYADYDPSRIRSHEVRFASPVFPGDAITFDLWRDGNEISLEASVAARGKKVITNGLTVLGKL